MVFNLADVALMVGVGLFYLDNYRTRSSNPTAESLLTDIGSTA